MGRYVYGDFEYKFAFAQQYSSFGEVLENIMMREDDLGYIRRLTDDNGEIIKLRIQNGAAFARVTRDFISSLNDSTQDLHDRRMMEQFLTDLDIQNGTQDNIMLEFEVEY